MACGNTWGVAFWPNKLCARQLVGARDLREEPHYNYFRDYDPKSGRYVESDPIGLDGGINSYTYALDNPAAFIDSEGLQSTDVSKNLPPLKRIHSKDTIMSGSNRYSYGFWNRKPLKDIVDSLCPGPGNDKPLRVTPDGRIYNGNIRTLILEERGYDIDSLPREIIEPGILEPR